MRTSALWLRALACAMLLTAACGTAHPEREPELEPELEPDLELEPRALRDFYPKDPNLTDEKQLLGALHQVLEKLQTKRISLWEKKFGRVPTCDVGEQCAVRKGARIGKMCDCPRSASCNFFLLKCL